MRERVVPPFRILAAVIGLAACSRLQPAAADRAVAGGGTVAALVANADTAVVLVYAPSDCFACHAALQPWLEWGRRHPGRLALVFTRPPTVAERVQLATYRIHADATLERGLIDRIAPPAAPVELLLVHGRAVESHRVARGPLSTPLFRRIAHANPRLDPPFPEAAAPGITSSRRTP
jgi:hypothetical protein